MHKAQFLLNIWVQFLY